LRFTSASRTGVKVAQEFKPLAEVERAGLLSKTEVKWHDGKLEGYMSTNYFDGTTRNPQCPE